MAARADAIAASHAAGSHSEPETWTETTLGQLADYINGYAFKPSDWHEQGLPIVRIAQLTDEAAPCDRYPGRLPEQYVVRDGDLIFSWSATLMTRIWDRGPAYLNQHLFKVVPCSGTSLAFLHHLLDFEMDALAGRAHGTTMRHIKRSDLLPFPVRVPSPRIQRAIASVLDRADDAIRKTEQVIAKLRRLEQGLSRVLLTVGIDDNGALRTSNHAETSKGVRTPPSHWRESTLGSEITLQRGFDITVAQQHPGDVPVVSSSGVTSSHDTAMVSPPGVVTGRKGKLGDVYFLDRPFWPHDTTLWVKDFHGNDPRFGALFLRSLQLERFDAATSVPTLNRNFVHPLPVSIPDIDEQRRIVAIMEAAEGRLKSEERELRKLRLVKHGIADDLLTGRVSAAKLAERAA